TGDLARWLEDGNIEFLGRIDQQVKVRGFRIELGEIEVQLLSHESIKEAVVIALDDGSGNKYLCAYYVPVQGDFVPAAQCTAAQLKEYLSRYLPDYMVPSYFVSLESLPLTPSGKVDRRNLPAPAPEEITAGSDYAAPQTPVEIKLAEIWTEVLGRETIGLDDNFFEIGGDSIKVIQIVSRMGNAGYKLETKDVLRNPQIGRLAPLVKKADRIADQSPVTGTVPLTPVQQWFFQRPAVDPHHFNQAVMFYSREGFAKEAVTAVFTKLQEHHDALRLAFKEENGEMIQTNHDIQFPLSLEEHDYHGKEGAGKAVEARAAQIQANIDLSKGPLMKLGLFHLDDGDRLLIAVHHLVMDGISMRILFEDIESLFSQYNNNETLTLPLKTDSFKVWAQRLTQYADSPAFLKEAEYWKGLEAVSMPVIQKDFEEGENYIKDTAMLSFGLSEEETQQLLTKANQAFGTEISDILLTALGLSTAEAFGHGHLLIAREGHGREDILADIDISRTIGWFTSIYPVLLDISYAHDLAYQVKTVKETLRRIPHKGTGYGILKYLASPEHKEGIGFQLNPQISFNYLGQFDAEVGEMSFQMARESAGKTESPNAQRDFELDITGMVTSKRLQMSVRYNKKQYKPQTVQTLIHHYKNRLQQVIEFCASRRTRQLTPSDLTYHELPLQTLDRLQDQYQLEDVYPLTPMQEGMLYHSFLEKSSVYLGQASYRLHARFDIPVVEKSLNRLFKRYDILRTAFIHEDLDRAMQVVLTDREVDFYFQDLRTQTAEDQETFIRQYRENDINRVFDLSNEPLLRVAVVRLGEDRYEFTWTNHHILIDGWCLSILIADFFELYRSFMEHREPRLPAVNPYKKYIRWLENLD
ncbi:MAG: non-ribosomal peptide synthetase, partial [bacterium]|nr:non-ribosomal peptide synthetase [bacterium]